MGENKYELSEEARSVLIQFDQDFSSSILNRENLVSVLARIDEMIGKIKPKKYIYILEKFNFVKVSIQLSETTRMYIDVRYGQINDEVIYTVSSRSPKNVIRSKTSLEELGKAFSSQS